MYNSGWGMDNLENVRECLRGEEMKDQCAVSSNKRRRQSVHSVNRCVMKMRGLDIEQVVDRLRYAVSVEVYVGDGGFAITS